jgi:hypothetical protein
VFGGRETTKIKRVRGVFLDVTCSEHGVFMVSISRVLVLAFLGGQNSNISRGCCLAVKICQRAERHA